MKMFKAAAVAATLALASAASLPSLAQVTESDVHMAQSAIMSSGSRAARIASIDNVPSVGVVRLDIRTVPRIRNHSIPDVSEFRILAQRYAGGIRRLRQALASNPVTSGILAERGIPVSRIVGVQVSSRGSLRLYLL